MFFNALRYCVFPLLIAALFAFGEYRKVLDKNAERRATAVVSGAFWGLLAVPFLLALNAALQFGLNEFFRSVAQFLGIMSPVARTICLSVAAFIGLFAYFPALAAYRQTANPYEYSEYVRRNNLPPLPPDEDDRRHVRTALFVAVGVWLFSCVVLFVILIVVPLVVIF